jgi:hypothetical protein
MLNLIDRIIIATLPELISFIFWALLLLVIYRLF